MTVGDRERPGEMEGRTREEKGCNTARRSLVPEAYKPQREPGIVIFRAKSFDHEKTPWESDFAFVKACNSIGRIRQALTTVKRVEGTEKIGSVTFRK